MTKKIDRIIKQCIKDNLFEENDIMEARVILTWLFEGKESAGKISSRAVENLEKYGFAKDDKLLSGADDEMTLWFCLAMAGAKGYVTQRTGN